MSKVIAAINMTLDGFCDHTAMLPDEEVHLHYKDLINNAGVILYGRITYQLMEYWQSLIEKPSGIKSMDDFAEAIDRVPKIVFSNTLNNSTWHSTNFTNRSLKETISTLKENSDKDILIGSRSLIMQLLKINLLDEFQLCIHPVITGGSLPLFENMKDRTLLKLIKTKALSGGAVVHYFELNKLD